MFNQDSIRRLLDDMPVPLMIYRPDGLLVAMNRRAEQFWSVHSEEIVGRFNLLSDPQSVAQGSADLFARALAGEQILSDPAPYDNTQTAFAVDERRQLWIQARIFPLRDEAGAVSHIALMHQDITEQVAQQEAIARAREEINTQRNTIATLTSPIIQVWEGILTVPLVGTIDNRRAMTVAEQLLEAIVAYQADIVILDITGVPVVDTSVASALLQTAQAVRLLGSQVVLVGVTAEVAQTLVHLGVDMSRITTLANLRAGIVWAFAQQGLAVTASPG